MLAVYIYLHIDVAAHLFSCESVCLIAAINKLHLMVTEQFFIWFK